MSGEELGQAVLGLAVQRARAVWGQRLVAAYGLGSLAHGGFSELVSDVDFGLVLEGPLTAEDAALVKTLASGIDAPLADRLSVFWGARTTLEGDASIGRFPPLDRLDLIRYGRLLHGQDVRDGLPVPSQRELVVKAAESGLGMAQRPDHRKAFAEPARLLSTGLKPLTKTILFPVRFLYTARTGEIGRNHDAANHFVQSEPGPMGDLAAAALSWRERPPAPDDASARKLLEAGLVPIYRLFLYDHAERMEEYGESELAEKLRVELALARLN